MELGLGDRLLNHVQDGTDAHSAAPRSSSCLHFCLPQALISKIPFKIIYEPPENRIVVYAAFNCSQDPQKWKFRVTGQRQERLPIRATRAKPGRKASYLSGLARVLDAFHRLRSRSCSGTPTCALHQWTSSFMSRAVNKKAAVKPPIVDTETISPPSS